MRKRTSISALLVLLFCPAALAQPAEEALRASVGFDQWTAGATTYAGYPLGDVRIEGLTAQAWDLRRADTDGVLARFGATDGSPAVLVRAVVAADAPAAHAWLLARLRGVARGATQSPGTGDVGFVAGTSWAAFVSGNVGVEVRVPDGAPEALSVLRAALALLDTAPRGTPAALRIRVRISQGVARLTDAPAGVRVDWRPRNVTIAPIADGVRLVSIREGARLDVIAVDPMLRIGRTSICP